MLTSKELAATAKELFVRIMQMSDNARATDEHRALNHLAVNTESPRVLKEAREEGAEMTIPGFTAEASLAPLHTHYRMTATSRTSFALADGGAVMPQFCIRGGCCCPPGYLPVGPPWAADCECIAIEQ